MKYWTGIHFKTDELLAFGNRVFGSDLPEDGFAGLLPKLASGTIGTEHFRVITEDEEGTEIAAMLVAMPVTLNVCGRELKVRYIGLVSVAPEARGKGYMRILMDKAVQEMKEEGCHISILGGQRQRYEYFGYEPAGFEVHYLLTQTNGRHALRQTDTSENGVYTEIVRMEATSDAVKDAHNLFCKDTYRAQRTQESFYELLCTWKSIPYEIRQNGRFAGYLCADGRAEENRELKISEIVLAESADVDAVLKACLERFGEKHGELKIVLSSFDRLNGRLGELSETAELHCNHSFLVLDYAQVLSVLLKWKAKEQGLVDGTVILSIDGQKMRIAVDNGVPSVERLGAFDAQETSESEKLTGQEISMTGREAALRLFSPAGALMFGKAVLKEKEIHIPEGWFPIELYLSAMDAC